MKDSPPTSAVSASSAVPITIVDEGAAGCSSDNNNNNNNINDKENMASSLPGNVGNDSNVKHDNGIGIGKAVITSSPHPLNEITDNTGDITVLDEWVELGPAFMKWNLKGSRMGYDADADNDADRDGDRDGDRDRDRDSNHPVGLRRMVLTVR